MSPAKPADLQIRNSTRERTDYTSLLAIPAVLDEVSRPSRPVFLHRSERDADSRVREIGWMVAFGHYGSFQTRWQMHIEHLLKAIGLLRHCKPVLLKEAQYIHRNYVGN
jgi:hypothetical protein